MSGKINNSPETPESVVQRKINIPVHMTDLSYFDDAYAHMKERFAAEMRRIDGEMAKFSTDLMRLYGQTSNIQTGVASSQRDSPTSDWEALTNSPFVEGEGENKTLKLQFDLSEFDPTEVKVRILNDVLLVSAVHEEKTDDTSVFREYNREFLLPKGIDPESVVSSISREGVLTVQAPLPKLAISESPAA
ncbi:hypothetical protein K1T71_013029 [Dendrolimus kikuchii]|uniref:Uncharacterized protein n=1 Tax=Dendrolimus kikuchii TaxID=765133 RepID=A0ACC1CIS7_9NEOP|nr:hypothetical protein K1T71_013029 [Dendrolimus kikuchii]